MLELIINKHTKVFVGDIDEDGHVELELENDMWDRNAYVYLNQDDIKKLIDHLNKQIS